MLKLYNTLTRKIEEFKPIHPPHVGFYSCGPTVYDYQHIGNYRTYVGADILQRVLEYNGYKVKRVMNITDVGHLTSQADTGEDKMEKSAEEKKKTVWEIADFYTEDFFAALSKLNIKMPNIVCKATDHIEEMIALIKRLEFGGYTYRISDGIYFDTSKLKDYGKLAKADIKGLKAGARVEMVSGKKNPTDFALWKFSGDAKRRQMEWDSPWGKGFPGWHIECSAMSLKYLGGAFENGNFHGERSRTIDIHSGGVDHIPIHHTNEIAQSEAVYRTVHGEAATGKPFVKYWVHFAFLLVNNEKMSKSLGNFYTQHDIEKKGFDLLDLRYLYLNTHYRSIMNFTWEGIAGAKKALERLREKVSLLRSHLQGEALQTASERDKYEKKFLAAINDDLNMPAALAVVWEMIDDAKLGGCDKLKLIEKFDEVLGLRLPEVSAKKEKIPEEILELAKEREKNRKEKNWQKSDQLRQQIEKKGYLIEDTPEGFKIKSKEQT